MVSGNEWSWRKSKKDLKRCWKYTCPSWLSKVKGCQNGGSENFLLVWVLWGVCSLSVCQGFLRSQPQVPAPDACQGEAPELQPLLVQPGWVFFSDEDQQQLMLLSTSTSQAINLLKTPTKTPPPPPKNTQTTTTKKDPNKLFSLRKAKYNSIFNLFFCLSR